MGDGTKNVPEARSCSSNGIEDAVHETPTKRNENTVIVSPGTDNRQSPTHCPSWCIEDHTGYDGGEIFHSGARTSLVGGFANIEEIYPISNLADAPDKPTEGDVGIYLFGDLDFPLTIPQARRFIALLQDAIVKLEEVAR